MGHPECHVPRFTFSRGKRKRRLPPLPCWEGACGPPAWLLGTLAPSRVQAATWVGGGQCSAGDPHFGRAQLLPCGPHSIPRHRPRAPPCPCHLALQCCLSQLPPIGNTSASCSATWLSLNRPPEGLASHCHPLPPSPLQLAGASSSSEQGTLQEMWPRPWSTGESPSAAPLGPKLLLAAPRKGPWLCCKSMIACSPCSFGPP